jgi:GntR family transcriptional regulator, transcriptional repressor for pyruvate dehydrogenase complex
MIASMASRKVVPSRRGAAGRPRMTMGSINREDRRRTLKTAERVAFEIVHDIVAQGLVTGARLPLEVEMVEQYSVSRASLREALRILEVHGLIRLKPGPGGGPVVGTVEPAHLARTASLYFHLSAATYAERAARNPMRRAEMAPFLQVASPGSSPEYHQHTIDFHQAVYALTANPVLTLLTQAVTQIITYHIVSTMDPVDLRGAIMEEHAELARAVAGGHPTKAARLMRDHFRAQHAYYAARAPDRLSDLVEWR